MSTNKVIAPAPASAEEGTAEEGTAEEGAEEEDAPETPPGDGAHELRELDSEFVQGWCVRCEDAGLWTGKVYVGEDKWCNRSALTNRRK